MIKKRTRHPLPPLSLTNLNGNFVGNLDMWSLYVFTKGNEELINLRILT